ncbi:fimbria/pilus outer membrane usher protein [Pseudomonas sp. P7759]|uniref:fimbria/pilus outer membrane usher protein n=1 Tax=Pseudomonas sp. P7759 TaxID=2738831 RepID=UPI00210AC2E6|nr:fimbria/pilus outer membrane usher protein [Pseudomonas sp. P7759]
MSKKAKRLVVNQSMQAPLWRLSQLSLAMALGLSGQAFAQGESTKQIPLLAYNTAFIQGLGQPEDLKQFIEGNSILPGTYRVDIHVNRALSGRQDVMFEQRSGGEVSPCLTFEMLRNLGLDMDALVSAGKLDANLAPTTCIDLKAIIPEANVDYEPNLLRLNINVPQVTMSRASRGYIDAALWDEGVTAAFSNYSLSGSRRKTDGRNNDSMFLNMRNGVNIGPWRLRNESSYSDTSYGKGEFNSNRNYAQRDITSLKSQLTLGETYTNSDIFDSVRFRGAQLGSDLAMLPESERGYAPVIRGVANSNATVEVKQNGYVLYNTNVSAGPFELTDIYPTGSNGDLEIVITEADGQVRTFTQAFASLPVMTRKGTYRYSLDVGQYDDQREDSEKPLLGTGNLVYGLTDDVTVFGGVMLSDGFSAANGGAGFNTPLGAVSLDATQSSSKTRQGNNAGQSVRFLYSKTLSDTSTTFTLAGYRYSTEGYRTLDEHVDDDRRDVWNQPRGRARSKFNLTVNQSLGRELGSLYLSASDQDYWNLTGRTRTLQAGYNGHWQSVNYSLNLSHSRYADNFSRGYNSGTTRDRDTQVSVSVSFPFGSESRAPRANLYATHDSNGSSTRGSVSGYVAGRDDLTYSVGGGRTATGETSGEGNISAKTPYANVGAGYSQGSNYKTVNVSARGSVVAHGGGINFGQPVGETFTLAEVENTAGVKVGNYAGIKTAGNGYAIIPNAQPYRGNWVNLNTQDLGADVDLESTSQQVIPRRGAITKASFKAKTGRRLEARFTQADGTKVPFGAVVEDDAGRQLAIVDPQQAALVLLEKPEGLLKVKWGEKTCSAAYSLADTKAGENYQSQTLTCQ